MLNYYKAEITIIKRLKFFSSQEYIEKEVYDVTFKEENLSALMDKVLNKVGISYIGEMEKVRETDDFISFTYKSPLPRSIYDRYVNNEIPFEEKSYYIKISRVFELGVSFRTIENLDKQDSEEELEELEV
jgi:hypothetical protein